jgi:hypothetical protein
MAKESLRQMIEHGAKTHAARECIKQCDALRGVVRQLKEEMRPNGYIEKIEREGLAAIRKDLFDNTAKEAERVRVRMEAKRVAHAKAYRENIAEHDRTIASFERKVDALSNSELEKMAFSMASQVNGGDPQFADIVAGELRARGSNEYVAMRELFVKADYDRPWLHDEEGITLKRELQFHSVDAVKQSGQGIFMIEAQGQGGKPSIAGISIKDVYEGE